MTRITKTQRWLDLVVLLLGRRVPLGIDEIMERVPSYAAAWRDGDDTARASVRRMFERDKDELRAAGIPIETVRYPAGYGREEVEGYRIDRGDFYLPYVRLVAEAGDDGNERGAADRPYRGLPHVDLTEREAELAMDALRRVAQLPAFPFAVEASSALRKLSFDIDPDPVPGDAVVWAEPAGATELLERLRVLSEALLARKRVRFVYHGIARGRPTDRDVAPYGLFFQRDWYLVGHDAARDALRVFRVSRARDLRPNTRSPKKPDYEIPADFRLPDYLDRDAWELGDGPPIIVADVRFEFPRSVLAARNGEGELVREDADGGAVRRFRLVDPEPFLRWILSQCGDARILSPPELVADLDALAADVAALHAAEVSHG